MCRIKEEDAEKLKEEYERLVQGLRDTNIARETDVIMGNPGVCVLLLANNCWLGTIFDSVLTADITLHAVFVL